MRIGICTGGGDVPGLNPCIKAVVGRVAEITELTEFKKPIRFCQVDVGEDAPRGIVCGARNFAEGDLIVAALPGSVLPGDFAIAVGKNMVHGSDSPESGIREAGLFFPEA